MSQAHVKQILKGLVYQYYRYYQPLFSFSSDENPTMVDQNWRIKFK